MCDHQTPHFSTSGHLAAQRVVSEPVEEKGVWVVCEATCAVRESPSSVARVACVRDLQPSRWLELARDAAPLPVFGIDCVCQKTKRGAAQESRALDKARFILVELGWEAAQLPRLLSIARFYEAFEIEPPSSPDRRAFFRRLVGAVRQAGESEFDYKVGKPSYAGQVVRVDLTLERERLLAVAQSLADKAQRPLPAILLNKKAARADSCCHHELSARHFLDNCKDTCKCASYCVDKNQVSRIIESSDTPLLNSQLPTKPDSKNCTMCLQSFNSLLDESLCSDCAKKRQIGAFLFGFHTAE